MKTPTGRAEGTQSAIINLYPLLGIHTNIKCLIFPFSSRFDILLGFETMQELKTELKCNKNEIIINGTKHYLENEVYYINNHLKIKELLRTDHIDNKTTGELVDLISKYGDIIKTDEEKLRSTNLLKHKIVTKNEAPCYTRNYRYPVQFKEQINEEVRKLLQNKIIRKSNSPYNSPVWIVPKKIDASGKKKIRMVIDYRKLNESTIKDKYPLPNIEDLLNKLQGAKIFSTVDLASGFHQIEMEEQSISKTAFSTEDGHYEFLRMPYGLTNAPPTFQRAMNMMIANVPNAMVYIDDIIIYSNTIEEHLGHLENVFSKLKEHALSIQLDKTEFFKTELPFLGYIVTPEGLKTNPNKIEAVTKLPYPKDEKTTRQFLGMTGYYRKFIKNYATITKPISKSLQTQEFLTEEIMKSCDELKQLMCNSPILSYPDWGKPFILTTDASDKAIGSVLSQKDNDGVEHPVAFASRVLQPPEINYSTVEKELLSVVWSTQHFKPYLYGTKFLLLTDHKPLKWIFTMKNGNTRIMKWIWKLNEFEFEIEHISGKTNVVADILSRQHEHLEHVNHIDSDMELGELDLIPVEDSPEYDALIKELEILKPSTSNKTMLDDVTPMEAEVASNAATAHSQHSSNDQIWIVDGDKYINIEKFQIIIRKGNKEINYTRPFDKHRYELHVNDKEDIKSLFEQMLHPKRTYGIYCEPNITFLKEFYDKIFLDISTIVTENYPTVKMKRYNRLVADILSKDEQLQTIASYHTGKTSHRGMLETYNKLRREYYFPLMKENINDYINQCMICKKTKYERKPIKVKYLQTPTPTKPFEELMIDTLHFESKYIITTIDSFSKKLFARIIPNITGIKVCEVLKEYLEHFPAPKIIKMDQGREFKNQLVSNFLETNDIIPYYTTAGNSNSLGLLNRLHNTLIEILRTLKNSNLSNNSIENRIRLAVIAYNNTVNNLLKLTPDEITFGIIRQTDNEKATNIKEQFVQQYHNEKRILHDIVKTQIDNEKEQRTTRLNKNREEPPDINEEQILLKTATHRKHENIYKPYVRYKDRNLIKTAHVNRMKRPRKNYSKRPLCVSDNNEDSNNSSDSDTPVGDNNHVENHRPKHHTRSNAFFSD